MNRKLLMNLQGMTFTEEQARDYYGSRFETTELAWVIVDEDGGRRQARRPRIKNSKETPMKQDIQMGSRRTMQ